MSLPMSCSMFPKLVFNAAGRTDLPAIPDAAWNRRD